MPYVVDGTITRAMKAMFRLACRPIRQAATLVEAKCLYCAHRQLEAGYQQAAVQGSPEVLVNCKHFALMPP